MTRAMHPTRITLSADVTRQVFNADGTGELARSWIRYLKGLLVEDGFDLEDVVAPAVRCIDLELAGMPAGIDGLRQYRDCIARTTPDMRLHVLYLTIKPGQSTIEAVIRCTGTPANGEPLSWDVRSIARFANGRLIERWDRADVPAILAKLRGAA